MINSLKKLFYLLVFGAGFSSASGVDVLFLHVQSNSHDSTGNEIAGYLDSMADVNVTTRYLTSSTATDDIANFEQVWVFDLSNSGNNSAGQTLNYVNICNWYASRPASQQSLILDGRILYSGSAQTSGGNGTGVSEQAWIQNYYTQLNIRGGGLVLGTDHDTYAVGLNTILSTLGIAGISGDLGSPPHTESVDSASPLQAGYSQINNTGSTGLAPTGHHGIGVIGQALAGQVLSPVAYRGTLPGSPEDNSTWAALQASVSSTIGSLTFGTSDIPIINDGNSTLSLSANEDNSTSFTLSSLTAVDYDTSAGSLSWSVHTAATNGTATVSGSGASPTTFNYSPNADFTGADSFVVQVTDGDLNGTITVNVTVSNVNDAPVIAQGTSIAVTMSEDGSPTAWAAPTLTASDVDAGDVLTWSANFLGDRNESLTFGGTGASPNFIYQPQADFNGAESLIARVTDSSGAYDEITVTITVTPVEDSPEITFGGGGATASASIAENQRTVGTVSVTEPDGDAFVYAIVGGADSTLFALDVGTGELSFLTAPDYENPTDANADGIFEVTVRATDSNNNTDDQAISVTVLNMIDLSTFIFSNAGSTGTQGPTQQQVDSAYTGTDLAGFVTVNTQGIQEWVAPFAGEFAIEALGASGGRGRGGSSQGGSGASMKGAFRFAKGDRLFVVVGQMGADSGRGGSAGGGTFVWREVNGTAELMVAAGGGGGGSDGSSTNPNGNGSTSTSGGNATGTGGQNGADGISAGTHNSYAGRGWNSQLFTGRGSGGFGGGGGGNHHGPGGAGGYSGGGSGSCGSQGGGGGGSYNSGTNQVNQAGVNVGHGKVVISALNTPPSDVNLLPFTIPENLSANTVVGNLSTVDPDDVNSTGTYQYALVDGNGSTDNASFSIDANGTLWTLATFDYEALLADANRTSLAHDQVTSSLTAGAYPANVYLAIQANYPLLSIRVRTSDEFNASHEKVMSVAVLDRNDEIPAYPAASDVALDNGSLKENQPAGTLSGQFRAPHAVAPDPVKTYIHTLVDGNGSADNASFVLDQNGTLRSAAIFDFETKSAYQIRVRSTDEFGGYRDEAFVINIVDCFIPVVETLAASEVQAGSAKLGGRLDDAGGLTILERGFVIGTQPLPVHGQSGVLVFPGQLSADSGAFEGQANGLASTSKYYLRAYARNSEGTGYGQEESFVTVGWWNKPSWTESTAGGAQDWWTSPWFGNFFQSANGWAMHEKMGWIYPVKGKSTGVWFWKKGEGWLWTDSDLYPRMYADSYKSWAYFYGAWEGKKLFYLYNEERWITSEEE